MADEILLECPAVPRVVETEYKEYTKRRGVPADDDARFDQALDFVMFEIDRELRPREADEPEEADVECMREWAFELLRRIGEPYAGHETVSSDVRFIDGDPAPSGGRWPQKNEALKRKLMR